MSTILLISPKKAARAVCGRWTYWISIGAVLFREKRRCQGNLPTWKQKAAAKRETARRLYWNQCSCIVPCLYNWACGFFYHNLSPFITVWFPFVYIKRIWVLNFLFYHHYSSLKWKNPVLSIALRQCIQF